MTIDQVISAVGGRVLRSDLSQQMRIAKVSIDSRQIIDAQHALFLALEGAVTDGHQYIQEAYQKGVRCFVVSKVISTEGLEGSTVILVSSGKQALQRVAGLHRSQAALTHCVGITGSNGKTIVKEWLTQALLPDFSVVKSPKSYNSQIGVPLSLLGIESWHDLGVFEAGISAVGEMQVLAELIQPNIGVFTHLGTAHDGDFQSRRQKMEEKAKLFEGCSCIILDAQELQAKEVLTQLFGAERLFCWGEDPRMKTEQLVVEASVCLWTISFQGEPFIFTIPFTDGASLQNLGHVIATLLYLGYSPQKIQNRIKFLNAVDMRMQLVEGRDGCLMVNDAYTLDLDGLRAALQFLTIQAQGRKKILILSSAFPLDFSMPEVQKVCEEIIMDNQIERILTVGKELAGIGADFSSRHLHFEQTADLMAYMDGLHLYSSIILFKGARKYRFEQLVRRLMVKSHSAILEIDLDALEHNVSVYGSVLHPQTKIMAVIKASAYGSGGSEIANLLAYKGIDYLSVALVDEGVSLRKSGVTIPIVVLNPEMSQMDDMVTYELQPEIFDFYQIQMIRDYQQNQGVEASDFPIHIKLDTGMHRLGFMYSDMDRLISTLLSNVGIRVVSVFSHLSSSEDASDDAYTRAQVSLFQSMYQQITEALGYRPLRHILNSSGITRFPAYQFDMVRLGLGLYGIDQGRVLSDQLIKVHTLKGKIIQEKWIPANEYIGYNRRFFTNRPTRIGILNLGYADGLPRSSGNGAYHVLVADRYEVPIIGNVCMDLTILDLTDAPEATVGTEVEVFGNKKAIELLARVNNTIPYEILTGISSRIRRVYTKG